MKLTVLTENTASGIFLAEHGLSYLVEIDEEQVLFDTGHSDVFLKNAGLLGIDIHQNVDKVVLSHGHWDHGDGLIHLKNKTLITHPKAFQKRFNASNKSSVGLSLSRDTIEKSFDLIESSNPFQINQNLWFLGEIPRINSFESQSSPFELENGDPDFIEDDSGLFAIKNKELIIITGCSHSGICNICEYAKEVSGIKKINTVIGGFHLKRKNRQTLETIQYFKNNNVHRILPSHCTDLPALNAFYSEFKIQQVKSGMVFKF